MTTNMTKHPISAGGGFDLDTLPGKTVQNDMLVHEVG